MTKKKKKIYAVEDTTFYEYIACVLTRQPDNKNILSLLPRKVLLVQIFSLTKENILACFW